MSYWEKRTCVSPFLLALRGPCRKESSRKSIQNIGIEQVKDVYRGPERQLWELIMASRFTSTAYYRWSKAFLEAGKNGLTRDTHRDATTDEVRQLKADNEPLKRALTDKILPQSLGQ